MDIMSSHAGRRWFKQKCIAIHVDFVVKIIKMNIFQEYKQDHLKRENDNHT